MTRDGAVCGLVLAPGRRSLSAFRRPAAYTEAYEHHASLESITAYIEKARKRQAEIGDELGWLEGLYLRRVAEKAVGLWATAQAEDDKCWAEKMERGKSALRDAVSGCPLSPERREWALDVLATLEPQPFGLALGSYERR